MRIRRKLLSISLAAALTAGMVPVAAAAEQPAFSDLEGHWGRAAVERWAGRGVVHGNGAGAFLPDGTLTRAELATILDNLLGLEAQAENPYADLNGDEWYAQAILACTAAGLTRDLVLEGDGTSCNALAPITRQETAVLMGRAFQLEEGGQADFLDQAQVASWAEG